MTWSKDVQVVSAPGALLNVPFVAEFDGGTGLTPKGINQLQVQSLAHTCTQSEPEMMVEVEVDVMLCVFRLRLRPMAFWALGQWLAVRLLQTSVIHRSMGWQETQEIQTCYAT